MPPLEGKTFDLFTMYAVRQKRSDHLEGYSDDDARRSLIKEFRELLSASLWISYLTIASIVIPPEGIRANIEPRYAMGDINKVLRYDIGVDTRTGDLHYKYSEYQLIPSNEQDLQDWLLDAIDEDFAHDINTHSVSYDLHEGMDDINNQLQPYGYIVKYHVPEDTPGVEVKLESI